MDQDLRTLEKEFAKSPDDLRLECRLRTAFIRAGQADKAKPLRVGDVVTITESADPWINGAWEGRIIQTLREGDMNIQPLGDKPNFRVKPAPEYLATGLYVAQADAEKAQVIHPVQL